MTQPQDSTPPPGLRLAVLPKTYGICRMSPEARIPKWIHDSTFYSVSRSPDELSMICEEDVVPNGVQCEGGWRAFRVVGTLDMKLMAVLASLSLPLADAQIGLITISTFDTDYLLVRAKKLRDAMAALTRAGHQFENGPEIDDAPQTEEPAPVASPEQEPQAEEPRAEAPQPEAPAAASDDSGSEGDSDDSEGRTVRRRGSRRGSRRRGSTDTDDASEPSGDSAEPAPAPALPPLPSPAAAPPSPAQASAGTEEIHPGTLRQIAEKTGIPVGEVTEELDLAKLRALQRQQLDPKSLATEEIDISALQSEGLDVGSLLRRGRGKDSGKDGEPLSTTASVTPEAGPDDDQPTPTPTGTLPADELDPVDEDDPEAEGLFTGAIPQNPVETTEDSFQSLGISPALIETLEDIGFHHPTPIQAAVIPIALEGGDVIGLAETGSGKTGAFGLPLAERLHHGQGLRGLILCPTREIALQTKAFLDIFGKNHDLETAVVIGGVKFGPQLQALRRNPDIIVATPGRLADHLRRGNVRLNQLEELVLDEADHMLDLGFLPQIQEILESVPKNRRTLMFSATMPPAIERLAQRFLNDPYTADLRPVNRVAAGIKHRLYLVKDGDQKDCLIQLLEEEEGTTLVFARRKLDTEWLARQLEIAGLPVDRIHSDRTQSQRVRALRAFRESKIRILVATDVAARGIDVPQLSHVVNFGLPETIEDYVHRAGRTARGKAVGTVSSIGTWLDKVMVKDIERLIGHEIDRCEVEGVDAYKELRPRRKGLRRRRLL